jgi:hypothetical protein
MREACVPEDYSALCMLNDKDLKVGTKMPGLAWEVDDLNASDKVKAIERQQSRNHKGDN